MSQSQLRQDQLTAANILIKVFNLPETSEAVVANQLFHREDTTEDDVNLVTNSLNKLKKNSSVYRTIYAELEKMRNNPNVSLPETYASLLFKCRKNHIYTSKKETDAKSEVSAGSSSPFLRRDPSRDPRRIKEEIVSPNPLVSSNGSTPAYRSRSRSNMRAFSSVSSKGTENYPYDRMSVEKHHSSIANPLYDRNNFKTPQSSNVYEYRTMKLENSGRSVDPPPYRSPALSLPPYQHRPQSYNQTIPMDEYCKELRGALCGLAGKYFVDDGRGVLVISKTCSIAEYTRQFTQLLLVMANVYLDLKRVAEHPTDNSIHKALQDIISKKLHDYVVAINDINLKLHTKNTIVHLYAKASKYLVDLQALKRCSFIITTPDDRQPYDRCYEMLVLTKETSMEKVIHEVVTFVLGVFCGSLKRWILKGEVAASDRWIIAKDPVKGYKLIYRPRFLPEELCEDIYKIGCSQHLMTGEDVVKLDAFKLDIETKLHPEMLLTKVDSFASRVREVTRMLGTNIVVRLKREEHLLEHLWNLRQFLLLDEPCFALTLYDRLMNCSQGLHASISKSDVSMAFLAAVSASPRSKSCKFPILLDTYESNTESPNSSSRLYFGHSLNPVYRVGGVSGRIFQGTEFIYESLFQFIWATQLSLFSLRDIANKMLIFNRTYAKYDKGLSTFARFCSNICHKFSRIVFHLRQYTTQTISLYYSQMLARLEFVTDIESAANVHNDFLKVLSADFFCDGTTTNQNISALIATILKQVYDFTKLINEFFLDLEADGKTFITDLNPYDTLMEFEQQERKISMSEDITVHRKAAAKILDTSFVRTVQQLRSHLRHCPQDNIIYLCNSLEIGA